MYSMNTSIKDLGKYEVLCIILVQISHASYDVVDKNINNKAELPHKKTQTQ